MSAEWPYIYFFRRPHRRNNTVSEYVGESVSNSNGKSTRHRTDLLFKSLGDSVGIFYGATVTSPVGICHFNSVGILNGEPVPSHVRVNRFESVGDSVRKITRQTSTLATYPFFINSKLSIGKIIEIFRRGFRWY